MLFLMFAPTSFKRVWNETFFPNSNFAWLIMNSLSIDISDIAQWTGT